MIVSYGWCTLHTELVSVTSSNESDAVVRMLRRVYTAPEDKGAIAVCGLVVNGSRCPIDFEFTFNISTEIQTAGIHAHLVVHRARWCYRQAVFFVNEN